MSPLPPRSRVTLTFPKEPLGFLADGGEAAYRPLETIEVNFTPSVQEIRDDINYRYKYVWKVGENYNELTPEQKRQCRMYIEEQTQQNFRRMMTMVNGSTIYFTGTSADCDIWTHTGTSTTYQSSTYNDSTTWIAGQPYTGTSIGMQEVWNIVNQPELQPVRERRVDKTRIIVKRKARQLLLSQLDEHQKRTFLKDGYFWFHAHGYRWKMKNGRVKNIEQWQGSTKIADYCIHPSMGVPNEDTVAAQMLMIMYEYENFKNVANRYLN